MELLYLLVQNNVFTEMILEKAFLRVYASILRQVIAS
jgi:hypothetical protein